MNRRYRLIQRLRARKDATQANLLVIYHGGCPDGTCSAAVALMKYPSAETVPALHGDPPPDVRDRDVLILDFSYARETLEAMASQARSLRVLDHHKTAQAGLEGFPGATFDMDKSGAGLTWDTLMSGPRPWLVDYVEDRDLWRWQLPNSRAVGAWILCLDLDHPESWRGRLEELTLPDRVIDQGQWVLRYQENWAAQVAATAEIGEIAGVQVPVVNAPHPLGSNVLELLYQDHPFAARWQRRADGLYQYSLASAQDGADVSEIAKSYGGGGHEHAAGFTVDRLIHV